VFSHDCSGWGDVCTSINGHGTKVAGIAGAFTNDGPIAGMAYNAALRSYRITSDCSNWQFDWAANAITWAVDHGAWVINMSATTFGNTPAEAEPLHDAIIYAYNHNVPVVVPAGNNNFSRFDYPTNPAQCVSTCAVYPSLWFEVITVGGTMMVNGNTRRLTVGSGEDMLGSNYGLPGLDLSAPGLDIVSTKIGGGTASDSGTSYSAPLVAGVVYLMKSRHPSWTVAQIKSRLWNTADKRGIDLYDYTWNSFCGGQSAELGCGVLDADSAVQ
jgi:membrane-anchored mycosin MYCP